MKMKKKYIAIAALAAVAVVVTLAVVLSKPYIPPRPEDTTLEFWICDDVLQVDWSGHDEILGWFGAREFLGKGYHLKEGAEYPDMYPDVWVSYKLTAWPDYSDGGNYITRIEITDPAVSVYGLTVESEPEEFERVMKSMGYKVEWTDTGIQGASKGRFIFLIDRGDEPVFRIIADVSNRKGIVF